MYKAVYNIRTGVHKYNGVWHPKMTFDLGYDPDTFYDDAKIDSMIQEVEDVFHLVLVAERMDESLVLLGHALCWPLHSMIALRKNARPSQEYNLTDEGRTPDYSFDILQ